MVFILWASYQTWRYRYFSDLIPNTADAQAITVSDRLYSWLTLDRAYLKEFMRLSKKIFSNHGGYFLIAASPLLLFIKRNKANTLLLLILASLIVTTIFNPFFFGSTRLDEVRPTTQLAVVITLILDLLIFSIPPVLKNSKKLLYTALISSGIFLVAFKLNYEERYYLCCQTDIFDYLRQEFSELAQQQALPRPTVSNPDLGAVSWHKQFNIVDQGMLGTPIMAKLNRNPVLSDYFFEFAAPDMIETHPPWGCMYQKTIFGDPRFKQRFDAIRQGAENGCPKGLWMRKAVMKDASTKERQLIDALKSSYQ